MTAQVLFWFSLTTLAYAFVGYPVLVALLARLRPRPPAKGDEGFLPAVTVAIVVRNGADRIANRVRNLFESDYPPDRLGVIVYSDGSSDGTEAALGRISDRRLRVIGSKEHRGKAAGINAAVALADGDVVVLGDARQRFAPDAIRQLVRHFADGTVGAVSGALEVQAGKSAVGGGIDAYWRLESFLRRQEAVIDSCIGCTGAICAIRRSVFVPLPDGTILDDVVLPMGIALQGYRIVYESAARATDPQPLEPAIESRRKRRTMAGNFQMLFRHPGWLLPWRNRLWWQLISHKYLRLLGFPLMVATLASNARLLGMPFYRLLLAGQLGFYLAAVLGLTVPTLRGRLFALPASFVFVNWRAMQGLADYLFRESRPGWDRAA